MEKFQWKRVGTSTGEQWPMARHGHRSICCENKIYFFGGYNDQFLLDNIFIYDPMKNVWNYPKTTGDIPSPRSAFGMAAKETEIFIFGGLSNKNDVNNDLYKLNTLTWNWEKMKKKFSKNVPCSRLGHSFTQAEDKFFLFGGLKIDNVTLKLTFLDDLFVLNVNKNSITWKALQTQGPAPAARESHSDFYFKCKISGKFFLVIYGGLSGYQRLDDVWLLDTRAMTWKCAVTTGQIPLPRSLHSATRVDNKMFIFGGWTPWKLHETDGESDDPPVEWNCDNDMFYLDLQKMTWQKCSMDNSKMPRPRTGHSADFCHNRLYISFGRAGYHQVNEKQLYLHDIWYLEVQVPSKPSKIRIIRATEASLDVSWTQVLSADRYILQIQLYGPAVYTSLKTQQLLSTQENEYSGGINKLKIKMNVNTDSVVAAIGNSANKVSDTNKSFTFLIPSVPKLIKTPSNPVKIVPMSTTEIFQPQNSINLYVPSMENTNGLECVQNTLKKPKTIQLQTLPNSIKTDPTKNTTFKWCTVGEFTGCSTIVQSYKDPNDCSKRINLIPGTIYRLRVAGVNQLGCGDFSNIYTFATSFHGYPDAPSSTKVTKQRNGISLSWDEPNSHGSDIVEYSVQMTVKQNQMKSNTPTKVFKRVYHGKNNFCFLSPQILKSAYWENSTRPTMIFRISARNKMGYGLATQVKYSQSRR